MGDFGAVSDGTPPVRSVDRPADEPGKPGHLGELPDPRSGIGHDYARVLHSGAFRRLKRSLRSYTRVMRTGFVPASLTPSRLPR